MHAIAFVLAIPAAIFLTASASGAPARTAAGVYGLSLVLAFGSSAAYHRLARTERAQRILQRVDHSMIFVLIAGSYTPLCVIALPRRWGIPLLALVWVVGIIGIALKVFGFHRFRNLGYWLYAVIVVAAAIGLPLMWRALSGPQFALVLVGGLLYIAGVPVLMRGRPNPWPGTFGYHEVWHAFTVAAGACQLCGVALLVR
jgi:hemolysin III